jgi:hypothetical protein
MRGDFTISEKADLPSTVIAHEVVGWGRQPQAYQRAAEPVCHVAARPERIIGSAARLFWIVRERTFDFRFYGGGQVWIGAFEKFNDANSCARHEVRANGRSYFGDDHSFVFMPRDPDAFLLITSGTATVGARSARAKHCPRHAQRGHRTHTHIQFSKPASTRRREQFNHNQAA